MRGLGSWRFLHLREGVGSAQWNRWLGPHGIRGSVVWIGGIDIMGGCSGGGATECASWRHQFAGEWYNWYLLGRVALGRHGCCSIGLLAAEIGLVNEVQLIFGGVVSPTAISSSA